MSRGSSEPRPVTSAQVREMSQNNIEIGSHTFNHGDLTQESPGRLTMDLTRSKQTLEELVGRLVLDLPIPPAATTGPSKRRCSKPDTVPPWGPSRAAVGRRRSRAIAICTLLVGQVGVDSTGGRRPRAAAAVLASLGPTDPTGLQ